MREMFVEIKSLVSLSSGAMLAEEAVSLNRKTTGFLASTALPFLGNA